MGHLIRDVRVGDTIWTSVGDRKVVRVVVGTRDRNMLGNGLRRGWRRLVFESWSCPMFVTKRGHEAVIIVSLSP